MPSPKSPPVRQRPWLTLWIVALLSLVAQLALCQFFSFGSQVPFSFDVDPSNLWKLGYHFPPTGSFQVLNWLGVAYPPQPLTPFSLAAAHLPSWWFFTTYAPVMATLALLAMTAFLREWDLPRPAALFGGVIYAWQGDILTFVYPGHYAYITSWPFFAVAAWGALRTQRTGHWAYALISGACCGTLVGLPSNTDRGGIDSLLIAALFLTPLFSRPAVRRSWSDYLKILRPLALCVAVAALIALAPLLSLFQSYIVGVSMAGSTNSEDTYNFVTQFSLGPAETLTYFVPGFFGWHMNSADAAYWGWIGEWPEWSKAHQGARNLNLAISTTGTLATVLALLGACLLLPGRLLGVNRLTDRQRLYGRVLLGMGFVTLILSWGWHTPLYRPLFDLPLMDKWRNPLKWLEITNFALVALSALGLQHLLAWLDAPGPNRHVIRTRISWFLGLVLVLLGLGLIASYPVAIVLAAVLQAEGFAPPAVAGIMGTMHTSVLIALVVMGVAWILVLAVGQPESLRGWRLGDNPWIHGLWEKMLQPDSLPTTLALGLAALAAAQLAWVDTHFIEPVPLASLTESNPLLEELRSESDQVRVSVDIEDGTLQTLLQNQFAAMDISCLDISAASRIPDDLNAFFQALDHERERLWFLAGVKNVVLPQQGISELREDPNLAANIDHASGYTLGWTTPDLPTHALVTLKDYLSKATFVPKAELLPTDEAVLKRLADPNWNPRESVLLLSADQPRPGQGEPGTSADYVNLKTYTPTKIEMEAETTQGGYVLINDQYDPDWRVQVNGRDAKLLRADYIMRAIALPPGSSTITLRYSAHYRVAGLNLPATAVNNLSDGSMLAAWLIAGVALWRRRSVAGPHPVRP